MVNSRLLAVLAFCAALFALCVIGLGAFTRLIDAGLGCPDWPGCYGHLTVPAQLTAALTETYPSSPLIAYKAWAEMIHRYFVGGLSTFILIIIAMIFSKKILRIRSNTILALALIFLLCYQIMLGRWTVTMQLLPVIVSQHLLGGFLILSTLWLIFLVNRPRAYFENSPHFQTSSSSFFTLIIYLAFIGLALLFFQILLGAWTSTNYASLSCPDFPFCSQEAFQGWYFKEAFNLTSPVGLNYEGGHLSEGARQTIQLTHRIGALILTLYMVGFMGFAFFKLQKQRALMTTLYIMAGLFIIQVCIGMTNVVFKLPVATAVAHNLCAVLLLISFITFIFQLFTTRELIRS